MEVKIRSEAFYDLALYGFSLSYKDRAIKPEDWWDFRELCNTSMDDLASWDVLNRVGRTAKTATANAGRGKGHDKFLRQIQVAIDIEAPRYWWSEFDTYKVGTVAQSESTMHTLGKRDICYSDLEPACGNNCFSVKLFNQQKNTKEYGNDIHWLKGNLPESYLQRRLVTTNYAVLRCIIDQRNPHKLPEWHTFIDAIYAQVEHPELLQA